MRKLASIAGALTACTALASVSVAQADNSIDSVGGVSIPQVTVRFGMEPYPPHTDAIIAVKNGWFNDVGINLRYKDVQAEQVAPLLISGSVDVASAAPALLIPSMTHGQFDTFVFGDVFQAYAIMAQPGGHYKSYHDFLAEGMQPRDALKAAMQQLKGKIFTYPAEAAIKPFIQLLFDRGGLALEDTTTEVQPDPNGVALMLSGRADFEIGGLPARITLEQQGYKQIVSAADLASAASASPNSQELRSITHVGWTTTRAYAAANHDTLLRLASVKFRIIQYQHEHTEQAIAIQLPYLNMLAGSALKPTELKVIYTKLDPSFTFDQQSSWFNNPKDPFYWSYEISSIIQSYVDQGLFSAGEFKASDISSADQVYQELSKDRDHAKADIATLKSATGTAGALRDAAQAKYDIFDYLDAARYAAAGIKAQH